MPRTINDIIPPSRRRPSEEPMPQQPAQPSTDFSHYAPPAPPAPPPLIIPRRRFPWGTALFAVIVIILVIGALYVFSGASIEITPMVNPISVTGSFTATPQSGDLPYEVVTVEKVASTSVPAESTATVQQSAQGTITISNNQSVAQKLITNTRFAAPNGLIYRIHQAVSVPAGSTSAPGTVTATVYADQPGAQYNIAATTFTVPGLANSPQFTEVTAKSAGAMTGGFSGTRGTVSSATDDSTHAQLQAALAASIQSAVQAQIPQGYVIIPGATQITYGPQPDSPGADDSSVMVNESADATAVVFPESALAHAIATQAIPGYTNNDVSLESVANLNLAVASSSQAIGTGPFAFNLSGSTTVVWSVDATKIAGAVAGKSKQEAQTTLKSFPEVSKAYIVIRPFWTSTFPTDPSKIKVTVDAPTQ